MSSLASEAMILLLLYTCSRITVQRRDMGTFLSESSSGYIVKSFSLYTRLHGSARLVLPSFSRLVPAAS
jgi:hypothetical protein